MRRTRDGFPTAAWRRYADGTERYTPSETKGMGLSEAYLRLEEALPARAATKDGFRAEPRALRAWLDALPLANITAAADEALAGLRRLNRQRVDAAQRLAALESLRPTLLQLVEAIDRQILGASFPLPEPKARFGESALEFQAELALGYRIALVELCAPGGTVGLLRGRPAALAALRALQHGGDHLARAYLLYRRVPAGAWQALHDVHRFATEVRLHARETDGVTPDSAYREILLLALMNPYRRTQREQVDAAAFARALEPHAVLQDGGSDGDVAVQTAFDRGPGYVAEERGGAYAGTPFLHLGRMLSYIDEQLERTLPDARRIGFRVRGGTELALDAELARDLVDDLGARLSRGHARLGGGYRLDSVLGLHDLHQVLAGGLDFERFLQRARGEEEEPERTPRAAVRVPVQVIDQAVGGYRLLWEDGRQNARIRVGEPVGLALPDGGKPELQDWLVGVVRWIRVDEDGAIDAGVELLTRRALPAGIRVAAQGEARAAMRGVLMAPMHGGVDAGYESLLASIELARDAGGVELTLPVDDRGLPALARIEHAETLEFVQESPAYRCFALPRALR